MAIYTECIWPNVSFLYIWPQILDTHGHIYWTYMAYGNIYYIYMAHGIVIRVRYVWPYGLYIWECILPLWPLVLYVHGHIYHISGHIYL